MADAVPWKVYTEFPGVQYWYDRHVRCWWAMRVDEHGSQLGHAEDAYSRREIKDIARQLSEGNDGER